MFICKIGKLLYLKLLTQMKINRYGVALTPYRFKTAASLVTGECPPGSR